MLHISSSLRANRLASCDWLMKTGKAWQASLLTMVSRKLKNET